MSRRGYIYLIRTNDYADKGRSVYEIGQIEKRSLREYLSKYNRCEYGGGYEEYITIAVDNVKSARTEIVSLFESKYTAVKNGGRALKFEGDVGDMIIDVQTICAKYSRVIVERRSLSKLLSSDQSSSDDVEIFDRSYVEKVLARVVNESIESKRHLVPDRVRAIANSIFFDDILRFILGRVDKLGEWFVLSTMKSIFSSGQRYLSNDDVALMKEIIDQCDTIVDISIAEIIRFAPSQYINLPVDLINLSSTIVDTSIGEIVKEAIDEQAINRDEDELDDIMLRTNESDKFSAREILAVELCVALGATETGKRVRSILLHERRTFDRINRILRLSGPNIEVRRVVEEINSILSILDEHIHSDSTDRLYDGVQLIPSRYALTANVDGVDIHPMIGETHLKTRYSHILSAISDKYSELLESMIEH